MNITSFTFNPFSENTYVLYDDSRECIFIDPGCISTSEQNEITSFVADNELTPTAIVNTHCHIDHVFGVNYLADKYDIPFKCNEKELNILRAIPSYAPMYGIQMEAVKEPDELLPETGTYSFGSTSLEIRFTPGHSPGSISLVNMENNLVIVGDVLFAGSIGRTDLPGGSFDELMESIRSQLLTLEDDVVVYNGHGPTTTIGHERVTNPFILGHYVG